MYVQGQELRLKKWFLKAVFHRNEDQVAYSYSVTKIPGPPLVPDPSFIRFGYSFQTLRLFATLRLLER